jgi:uncharacterized protein YecE (DUF72 family)
VAVRRLEGTLLPEGPPEVAVAASRSQPDEAAPLADRIASLAPAETWIYVDNDTGGAAVRDAPESVRMLHERGCAAK